MNKKLVIYTLVVIAISSIATYVAIKGFPRISTKKPVVRITQIDPEEDAIRKSWEDIKSSSKFQTCLKSKADLDAKGKELEPKYRENLVKEKGGASLTKQELYITYLYNYFTNRGGDYKVFSRFDTEPPSQKSNDSMDNLLKYVYCPDISKISMQFPTTVDSCIEITSTWMLPFEVPEQRNYRVPEEYDLAKEQFEKGNTENIANVRNCCLGNSASNVGQCSRVRVFMN